MVCIGEQGRGHAGSRGITLKSVSVFKSVLGNYTGSRTITRNHAGSRGICLLSSISSYLFGNAVLIRNGPQASPNPYT